uniref:Secreted protein n=1 Tax=Steinernema glaseri TaxID=37863 RepID=A0A1I7YFC8_9BILA
MFPWRLLLVSALLSLAASQKIRQCTCAEVQPCKAHPSNLFVPCVESCKGHLTALGADYKRLQQCLVTRQAQFENTVKCTEASLANTCAARPGPLVDKRYPETLKLAAFTELNKMIQASGAKNQLKQVLASGKKVYDCVRTCLDKQVTSCLQKLKCGLALPPDSALVQTAKRCAIQSGLNSAGVQQLCDCAASAGIKQLQGNICNKIVIS